MSCPNCGQPAVQKFRPFCCKRCADVDLARWLNGSYRVMSEDPDDPEGLDAAMDEALRQAGAVQKPH